MNSKAILHLVHFILKMNTEELRYYKNIQWKYFPLPMIWSKDERREGCPVKLLNNQFQLLVEQKYQCSCTCSRGIYGKYWKPSILLVLFLFVSNSKALFVLHFWNLTSELLRRKNLHLLFRSHVSVPTGRPNRCRILLFNAFSNESFFKWLKHYL